MSYEWQRSRDMPDFTRSGQSTASGGRLVWLLVVIAVLGGFVLFSAFSYGPTPVEHPGGASAVVPEGEAAGGAAASGD